ncbi:MAG: SAM-dependent methyltransferase [Bacteroidetes bacterium]|nr:SAM-dependent methyltransferase [Bacteroidota bacterium]
MNNQPSDNFFEKLHLFISRKTLIKLVISNPRIRTEELKSLIVTLVELKSGIRLNVVYRYPTKDITKNYPVDEGIQLIKESLQQNFYNADLFSAGETVQLSISKNNKVNLSVHSISEQLISPLKHDRIKARIIETPGNIYLRELGILNANFELRREMSDKYIQINRYVELLEPFIRELQLPDGFQIADMGSGKGYLTFALYDYLTTKLGKSPVMIGVESRDELVKLSNEIAEKSGFTNLHFITGTIKEVALEKIDILIALHACDTATDDAIFRGITAGASLIVCAPCCHKQIRKNFKVTNALKDIMKHGILEERQAEIITDGIRALILEAHGYKTQVFEFISTEHTQKNVMIVGRKIIGQPIYREKNYESIRELKEFFGIKQHYLEELFVGQAKAEIVDLANKISFGIDKSTLYL